MVALVLGGIQFYATPSFSAGPSLSQRDGIQNVDCLYYRHTIISSDDTAVGVFSGY